MQAIRQPANAYAYVSIAEHSPIVVRTCDKSQSVEIFDTISAMLCSLGTMMQCCLGTIQAIPRLIIGTRYCQMPSVPNEVPASIILKFFQSINGTVRLPGTSVSSKAARILPIGLFRTYPFIGLTGQTRIVMVVDRRHSLVEPAFQRWLLFVLAA